MGNFRFCEMHRSVPRRTGQLSSVDEFILNTKYAIRKMVGSQTTWYGLDTSVITTETVPLLFATAGPAVRLERKPLEAE